MSFPAGFRPISPVDPVVSERTNERAKRNRDLLNSGQGADFTVTCRDQVWKVHEAIVCPSSKFIASALESGFRESGSRNVTIDYDEPALICRMLKCFYVFNYSDTVKDDLPDMETLSWPWVQDLPASDSHNTPSKLEVNARMYILGDTYGIDSLKKVAIMKFNAAGYVRRSEPGMPDEEIYSVAVETAALSPRQLVDTLVLIWENTYSPSDTLRISALTLIHDIRETIQWNGELERLASLSPKCAGAIITSLMRELRVMHESEE